MRTRDVWRCVAVLGLFVPQRAAADDNAKVESPKPAGAPLAVVKHHRVSDADDFGLIALLRRSTGPPANGPWGGDEKPPPEPTAAVQAMWKPPLDDAVASGLQLSGIGTSRGKASPTGAVAQVGTAGHGDGTLDLAAFDHRESRVREAHDVAPPKPPSPHLPMATILGVVQANVGRFGVCYEEGRRRDAMLHGRVVVKFVIDGHGLVAWASDAGSDLADASVVSCIVRAFDTLVFPESPDAMLTVLYPLVFRPP
jgi:hypothetical protein